MYDDQHCSDNTIVKVETQMVQMPLEGDSSGETAQGSANASVESTSSTDSFTFSNQETQTLMHCLLSTEMLLNSLLAKKMPTTLVEVNELEEVESPRKKLSFAVMHAVASKLEHRVQMLHNTLSSQSNDAVSEISSAVDSTKVVAHASQVPLISSATTSMTSVPVPATSGGNNEVSVSSPTRNVSENEAISSIGLPDDRPPSSEDMTPPESPSPYVQADSSFFPSPSSTFTPVLNSPQKNSDNIPAFQERNAPTSSEQLRRSYAIESSDPSLPLQARVGKASWCAANVAIETGILSSEAAESILVATVLNNADIYANNMDNNFMDADNSWFQLLENNEEGRHRLKAREIRMLASRVRFLKLIDKSSLEKNVSTRSELWLLKMIRSIWDDKYWGEAINFRVHVSNLKLPEYVIEWLSRKFGIKEIVNKV